MIKKFGMLMIVAFFLFISSRQIFAYNCYWDANTNTCTCNNPVNPVAGTVTWTPGINDDRAVFKVDMSNYTKLQMFVVFQDPNKWVLNVGDSPTNNGWAGDAATFYNDAEMQILNTQMSLYFNQYDYLDPGCNVHAGTSCNPYSGLPFPYPSASMDGVILPTGITKGDFTIKDQFFYANYSPTHANLKLQSPYLLRLGGKDDEQPSGMNDKIWYIGVNRVISGPGSRVGKGVRMIWFNLQ